jgi:hypothetical protein
MLDFVEKEGNFMRLKVVISSLCLLGLLTACGSAAGIQEETEYESFRDTINSDDFSGFAYLLRSPEDAESGVHHTVGEVFENNNEELYFLNLPEQNEKIRDLQNEDSRSSDIYFPSHKVAFIDQGQVIDELDIDRDELHASEHNNELAAFIQQYQ